MQTRVTPNQSFPQEPDNDSVLSSKDYGEEGRLNNDKRHDGNQYNDINGNSKTNAAIVEPIPSFHTSSAQKIISPQETYMPFRPSLHEALDRQE